MPDILRPLSVAMGETFQKKQYTENTVSMPKTLKALAVCNQQNAQEPDAAKAERGRLLLRLVRERLRSKREAEAAEDTRDDNFERQRAAHARGED